MAWENILPEAESMTTDSRASPVMRLAGRHPQRLDAGKERIGLEQHSLAAAEWTIVHRSMTIRGERPQVVDSDFNEPGVARPAHNAVIQRTLKKSGKMVTISNRTSMTSA